MPKGKAIAPRLRNKFGLVCKVRGCKKIAPGARFSGMCRTHAQRKQQRGHPEQEIIPIAEIRRSGERFLSLLQQGVKKKRADVSSLERFNEILKERHAAQLDFFNDVASGRHDPLSRNKYAVQAAERLSYAFKRLSPQRALLHLLGVFYLASQGRYQSQTAAEFGAFMAIVRNARETYSSRLHLNPFEAGAKYIPKPYYVACYYNARSFGGSWLWEYAAPFASIAFRLDKLKFSRKQTESLAKLFESGFERETKKLNRASKRLAKAKALSEAPPQ